MHVLNISVSVVRPQACKLSRRIGRPVFSKFKMADAWGTAHPKLDRQKNSLTTDKHTPCQITRRILLRNPSRPATVGSASVGRRWLAVGRRRLRRRPNSTCRRTTPRHTRTVRCAICRLPRVVHCDVRSKNGKFAHGTPEKKSAARQRTARDHMIRINIGECAEGPGRFGKGPSAAARSIHAQRGVLWVVLSHQ